MKISDPFVIRLLEVDIIIVYIYVCGESLREREIFR